MGRTILGVIGGFVAGVIVMIAAGWIGGLVFPVATPANPRDPEQVKAAFAMASAGSKAVIFLSWAVGAFAGVLAAKAVARRQGAAWTLTGLFTLYVLASVTILPAPAWMKLGGVVLTLLAGLAAERLVPSRLPDPVEADADAA